MKKIINKSKQIFLALVLSTALLFIPPITVHAQEINPTPGTYSYGSTSEFSPYVALSSSGSLAPTGDSQAIGYLVIAILLALAGSLTILTYKLNKKQN